MEQKDNPPAFPTHTMEEWGTKHWVVAHGGMSLRDWYAGQALTGILAHPGMNADNASIAQACYSMADDMLKAREQA